MATRNDASLVENTLDGECGSCARAIDEDLDRCPECGRDLSPSEPESDEPFTGMWHTIGAALDADIQLDAVEGKHARVRRVEGGKLEIVDLGSEEGVFVDGQRVKRAVVARGARIQLGEVALPRHMVPDDVLEPADLPQHSAPILLGRDKSCEFPVADRGVSARHARLFRDGDALVLEDLDSSNGTFVDGRRIKRMQVGWRQTFKVGTTELTALDVFKQVRKARAAASTAFVDRAEFESYAGPAPETVAVLKERTVVGRGSDVDLVIDSPQVSLKHCVIERRKEGGFVITDLDSTNGTYVGGKRIARPTPVAADQLVYLGSYPLRLSADGRVASDATSKGLGIRLDVQDVVLHRGGGAVVDGVSLTILPGELVAVMGPSGAGKTSLLTVIAGNARPTSGQVLFSGLDLYAHFDLFRHATGYVPQEDIMHRSLSARQVLHFTGRLSFPDDTDLNEIRRRSERVLRKLDLAHVADSVVGDDVSRGISGGQRKRLNVAMELMKEPSLLLLDEPTSGLDGRSAMQLVRQCRALASGGRTVVMTIHQPRPEALQLFDKVVILAKGGKLAFFGPPAALRSYFEERTRKGRQAANNDADFALEALEPEDESMARPPADWEREFRASPLFTQYVQRRKDEEQAGEQRQAQGGREHSAVRQFTTLAWRYGLVKVKDPAALLLQLLQAPMIAVIAAILFRKGRFVPLRGEDDVTPALFVLVASAVWFGISNVAREIVGERAVFLREAKKAVRVGPYLSSIIAVQAALMLVQVVILVAIVHLVVGFEGNPLAIFGVVFASGMSAMMMGLLLSSMVGSQLAAVVLVPLLVLPQILLCGQLAPVAGETGDRVTAVMAAPMLMRWAYSAATQVEYSPATENLSETAAFRAEKGREWVLPRLGFADDRPGLPLAVMGFIGVLCGLATALVLRRSARASGGRNS